MVLRAVSGITIDHVERAMPRRSARIASSRRFSKPSSPPARSSFWVFDLAIELAEMTVFLPEKSEVPIKYP